MRLLAKALVVVLLAAVTMASVAAEQLVPVGAPQQRPVGCHENGSNTPGPVSHRCCQTGHHAALLHQCLTSPSLQAAALVEFAEPALIAEGLSSVRNLSIPPGSPPIMPSLRI